MTRLTTTVIAVSMATKSFAVAQDNNGRAIGQDPDLLATPFCGNMGSGKDGRILGVKKVRTGDGRTQVDRCIKGVKSDDAKRDVDAGIFAVG